MPDLDPRQSPSGPPGSPRSTALTNVNRRHLLEAAITQWLQAGGIPAATATTAALELAPAAIRWLDASANADPARTLPALGDHLATMAPAPTANPADFLAAFAHALITQAIDEVAREAQRAGHADTFAALRPGLHAEPAPLQLAAIGARLGLSASALAIARTRLQRRVRQRLDAGLRLWASSPESRQTLRRQLHASLVGQEVSP